VVGKRHGVEGSARPALALRVHSTASNPVPCTGANRAGGVDNGRVAERRRAIVRRGGVRDWCALFLAGEAAGGAGVERRDFVVHSSPVPASSAFADRVVGALRLDSAAYADAAGDDAATWQAFVVLAVSVAASQIATAPDLALLIAGGTSDGGPGLLETGVVLLFGTLVAFVVASVCLVVWAGLLAAAATMGIAGPETGAAFRRLRRALGFAIAPQAFQALALVPTVGWLLGIAVTLRTMAASVVAIREALRVSTGRAIAAVVGSWIVIGGLLLLVVVLWWAAYR
jgi:hypothetical protein